MPLILQLGGEFGARNSACGDSEPAVHVCSMCQCAQVIVRGEDAAEHVHGMLRAGRECRSAGLV